MIWIYIENTNLTDEQIGNHFDLIITPHVKPEPSIRSQVLNLMKQQDTWQLSDIASEIAKQIHRDYNDVVNFVESILESIPEITKAGDARYRLSEY